MPTKTDRIEDPNPPQHVTPRRGRLPRISESATTVEDAVRLKEETDLDLRHAAKLAAAAQHEAALKIYSRAQILTMRPPTEEDEELVRRALRPAPTLEEIAALFKSVPTKQPRAAKRNPDERKQTIAKRKAAHPNWDAHQICISIDEKMANSTTSTKKAISPLPRWVAKTGGKKNTWCELHDDKLTKKNVQTYIDKIPAATTCYR
jgi:hypothetical protein